VVIPSSVDAAATAAGIRATGTSPSGSPRQLLTLITLQGPGTACAARALSTGQLSADGGPAPAAAALGLTDPPLAVPDPIVAELSLRRLRFWTAGTRRHGRVHAVGGYVGPAPDLEDGLIATVRSAEGIVVGARFHAEDCRVQADGVVRCVAGRVTGDERPRLRLVPVRSDGVPTGEWKVTLWIPSFDVVPPLSSPASVVLSTPSRHLVGAAEGCQTVRRGGLIKCEE
jgi:hypothetical protein